MPGFDGTGPLGQGPLTGGEFGNCTASTKDLRPPLQSNQVGPGAGRGGIPRGGGRGRCFGGGRGGDIRGAGIRARRRRGFPEENPTQVELVTEETLGVAELEKRIIALENENDKLRASLADLAAQ